MTKTANKSRRAQPREVRREQLIQATIKCIARHGLSGVTMGRVTKEAGLSMGIANLHFESKEKLLLDTLRLVTEEYAAGQAAILSDEDYPSTAARPRRTGPCARTVRSCPPNPNRDPPQLGPSSRA